MNDLQDSLPVHLNIVVISETPATPLFSRWFDHIDNTVRHRVQRGTNHDVVVDTLSSSSSSHKGKKNSKERIFRYNYTFHSLSTTPEISSVISQYVTALARTSIVEDTDTPPSAKVVDVNAVDNKLSELLQIMTSNQDLPLGYTLFVLNLSDLAEQHYVYQRGWSEAEIIALAKNPGVQSAAVAARERNQQQRKSTEFNFVEDDDDLFETDIVPADIPRAAAAVADAAAATAATMQRVNTIVNDVTRRKRISDWSDATKVQIKDLSNTESTSKSKSESRSYLSSALRLLREKTSPRQRELLYELTQTAQGRETKYATFQDRSHSLPPFVGQHRKNARCSVDSWLNLDERFGWFDMNVFSEVNRGDMGTFRKGVISRKLPEYSAGKHSFGSSRAAVEWYNVRRLTPIISSFMRHVVTPPTTLRAVAGRKNARNARRIERVSFHVHVVDILNQWNDGSGESTHQDPTNVETNMKNERNQKNRKKSGRTLQFDLKSFKRQITKLRAPDQEFSFTFQRISLNDDPVLASAYYTALRFAVEPTLHILQNAKKANERDDKTVQAWYENVAMDAKRVVYLDARRLHNQLSAMQQKGKLLEDQDVNSNVATDGKRQMKNDGNDNNKNNRQDIVRERNQNNNNINGRENILSSMDVPIFIFAHALSDLPHVGTPVMMKGGSASQSIGNMVFAVEHGQESSASRILWETAATCDGSPLYENIGNPIRPTLRAVSAALGGMRSLHKGPDVMDWHAGTGSERKEREDDWQWAVGASPLSHTETSINPDTLSFSKFSIDALHRSQIAQAMVASQLLLKGSDSISKKVATLHPTEHSDMISNRTAVLSTLKDIHQDVLSLDLDLALRRVKDLLRMSRDFEGIIQRLETIDQAHDCRQHGQTIRNPLSGVDMWWIGGILSVFVILSVVVLWCRQKCKHRRRSLKPKIN